MFVLTTSVLSIRWLVVAWFRGRDLALRVTTPFFREPSFVGFRLVILCVVCLFTGWTTIGPFVVLRDSGSVWDCGV